MNLDDVESLICSWALMTAHILAEKMNAKSGNLMDIIHSSQYSTTGVTKARVCAILSVGWCI